LSTLLFLGAGASQPFDIPTMTGMVTKFEKHLEENNISERFLYSRIKEELGKGFDASKIDIESVFSVIHGIIAGITPQKMGPFPYYYISRFSSEQEFSPDEIKDAKKLQKELESFIKKECQFVGTDEDKMKIYEQAYDPLFKYLWGVQRVKNPKGLEYSIGWKAYTTNYDLIFESYWKELAKINDFLSSEKSEFEYFDQEKCKANYSESFAKLHGSLDWEMLDDNSILRTSSDTFTRFKKRGTVMLYPIQQKDLYLHPWIHLFQELKQGLQTCDLWYVIGYAFNDEFILEIFKEAFSNKKRMVIISPHAKDMQEKFEKKLHDFITPLPIKFGDKYFSKQFEDFSKEVKTLDIKIKTKNEFIGFKSSIPIRNAQVVEKDGILTKEATVKDASNWREVQIMNPNNEEIQFRLQIEHRSPYEKDLELQISLNGVNDYEYSVYLQDRFLDSDRGNTAEQDQTLQRHLSKPIKIYANNLFLR